MDQEILKRIDLLAAKLGTRADKVWALLLKQAVIEGWSDLICGLLMLAATVLCGYLFCKILKADNQWYGDGHLALIVAAIGLVCLVGGLVDVNAFYTPLLNPGYWALTEITKTLK